MGKKLAIVFMLAFVCSINHVYSGPRNKISDLSAKFRYALYILNDADAEIVREFLLLTDSQVRSCCPVKFYQGRYYRVVLLNNESDDEDEHGYLCDDVQMGACHSLPANTPLVTPANTPVMDPKINPFFPPDDRYAPHIPTLACHPDVIIGQRLSPEALRSLSSKITALTHAENSYDLSPSVPLLEAEISSEMSAIAPEQAEDALYFYLKKRQGMNENRIFFTHNRASESNIIMVIRRSFRILRDAPALGEMPSGDCDCLEISIPVGTFEFAAVEDLLSQANEYSACSIPWQQHVIEHGLPDDIEDSSSEPDMVDFSNIALLDCLHELELHWNPSNPIDNPMVERVLGTGVSSVVVSLFNNFRSLAFKRLYRTTKTKKSAMEVPSSARINLLLLSTYGVPVAPMRYEVVYNEEQEHYAIYCIQTQYQPEQFADHFLEDPDNSAEEKMTLINTIIHYMNLCDISNGYQLRVDDGFKGYFRVVVDSNYPNYCFINGTWYLIDLSPFFWCVGDHFSSANHQILDMSQSEDYYSFIKSLCTNPIQLYVFFCGRMFRPHQKYSGSTHPDLQRKAKDWLGLYNYALRRVATLPQITHEFGQQKWLELSAFDEDHEEELWQLLVSQRNADPSNKFLDGVVKLARTNKHAGHPVILDGAMEPWQQPPHNYHRLTESMGYVDPVDYLSMTEEQRKDKKQADIFDISASMGVSSPEVFLAPVSSTPQEIANRRQFLEFLRIQALMKTLSQNMAKDNNQRAANRRRMLREQRESNPPPPPVIYTHLTALNNEEMADYLNLQFNAEYIPVESDGNCLWNALAIALRKKGIIINPQHLMRAILPPPDQQGAFPEHQQNWGDTDFITKILQYLAQHGTHVGIVVIQPYGSEMVAVWYGLTDGQLTVLPLGNNPVEIQQAIQDPNNITLVNHQNGNDGDFQVNHWGAAVPMVLTAGVHPQITEPAPDGSVIAPADSTTENDEPAPKRVRLTPGLDETLEGGTMPDTTSTATTSPHRFEQQFQSATGLNLLRATNSLPHPLPGAWQPLTDYRNLLLSLITNYLLMCNTNMKEWCSYQLDGILSLLPQDQQVNNQNLQTGSIEPFLHLMTALLRWMNPQPVQHEQIEVSSAEITLTEITIIFPFIGNRGLPVFAAWRLTLVPSARGYLHLQRRFIRNLDVSTEDFLNKRRLYFVTNIPITPMGNLAWPFHNPNQAQWWLVVPQIHATWMLGTALEEHVEQGPEDDPGSNPGDLQREISDEVSQLEISSTSPESPGIYPTPVIRIAPPSPDGKESTNPESMEKDEPTNKTGGATDRAKKHSHVFETETQKDDLNQFIPEGWRLPVPEALSIGKALVPLLLFRKQRY